MKWTRLPGYLVAALAMAAIGGLVSAVVGYFVGGIIGTVIALATGNDQWGWRLSEAGAYLGIGLAALVALGSLVGRIKEDAEPSAAAPREARATRQDPSRQHRAQVRQARNRLDEAAPTASETRLATTSWMPAGASASATVGNGDDSTTVAYLRSLRTTDPERVGSYRVVGVLGQGASGVVYHATRGGAARYALKLVTGAIDGHAEARFAREVEILGRVRSRYVVSLVEHGIHEGMPFLVMDAVSGPTLRELLDRTEPPSPHDAEQILLGLAHALADLHGVGVLHRDVKPANVVVTPVGPVLVDLGIAHLVGGTRLTTHGVLGTPGYMAPELLAGYPATAGTDVWAWAKTSEPLLDRARRGLEGDVVSDRLAPVVNRAGASDPKSRYDDGQALYTALLVAGCGRQR